MPLIRGLLTAGWCLTFLWSARVVMGAPSTVREIVVTNDLVLAPGEQSARLIIRASHITIDGNGATLIGPGEIGKPQSLEAAGPGIVMEGATSVVLKRITARGFATGLILRDSQALSISDCDFSDNYHNPAHGWGELPPRGGILCERVRWSVLRHNRATRVWDALHLVESDDNLIAENDFSHTSNTGGKLWNSSRNRFLNNNFSYGIRIDRSAGEVHARDSTGVLLETGSNDNYWYQNDITYGGDGIFIRPLNRWISRGNVFVENDTSYANNNCVESWSPGNTFIRNKANHGSYGFWLGGSDQTVLIGNEAAFNGLTNGNHNAPEPGFQHGGIVLVGGSSSHTVIEGNHLHDNNGAGLAFRGDVATRGELWKTEHWVVQRNRIANNRFGIWGRWGEAIVLAANTLTNNSQGNYFTNITTLLELPDRPEIQSPPTVRLLGPRTAWVGDRVQFDGSKTTDRAGLPLRFHWWLEGSAGPASILERTFERPGFYRVELTVDNGGLAGLAWQDLLVLQPVAKEYGTESSALEWGFELQGNDSGRGQVVLQEDLDCVVGKRCLRWTPSPYPGEAATVIYPKTRDGAWDWSGKSQIRFLIKAQNPNLPGFQNAGPIVRLLSREGHIELKPVQDANFLNDPPFSEGRWQWIPLVIPLAGDSRWERTAVGQPRLDRIDALSVAVDSWGGEPFTVWLDGLTVD